MSGVYINFLEKSYNGVNRVLLFPGNQQTMSLSDRQRFVDENQNNQWMSLEVVEVRGRNNIVSKGFLTQNGPGTQPFLVRQPELVFLNKGIGNGIFQLLGFTQEIFLLKTLREK